MIPVRELSEEQTRSAASKRGIGYSTAHYGELFQGQVQTADGVKHRCLLSLPCGKLYSHAIFQPGPPPFLRVEPPHKSRARRAAEICLRELGETAIGGSLTIDSNIVEAKGYGSSTADCVASVLAVANSRGRAMSEILVARMVVEAETASDNVMFSRAVLFAQREGVVLEDYGVPVPWMDVIGFDTELDGQVDTLTYPPAEYSRAELDLFRPLTGALRRALKTADIDLLGRVSTASAMINDRLLPKRYFNEIRKLASLCRAAGVSVAHSGTVMAVLFDPTAPGHEARVDLLRRKLEEIGVGDHFRFQTKNEQSEESAA